jgi:predicted phage-related endonuclease
MIEKIKWSNTGHEAWLKQRRSVEGFGSLDTVRFGASDVGTILGVNKWKCKRRLFEHVIGRHTTEWRTESSVAGHLLEPVISSMWESWQQDQEVFLANVEQDIKLRKTKKADFFLLNSKYPHLFASIDRLHSGKTYSPFTGELYDPLTPIELKTTQSAYYKLWENGITKSYMSQLQTQMMLSDTKVAVFAVLISGVQFKVMEVEYDSLLAESIAYEVDKFAHLCIAGKQLVDLINNSQTESEREQYLGMLDEISPEVSALEDEQVLLKELNPNSLGTILGDESDFKYLVNYQCAQDNIKEFEEAKQRAKNNILSLMKDTEVMEFERGKVTWRRTPDKRDYFAIKLYK